MQQESKIQPLGEIIKQGYNPINQKSRYSEYAHIELTDEEIEDALGYRKMLKAISMEDEDKKKQKQEKRNKLKMPWSYDQLYAEILERTKQLPFEFDIDKDNERVIELLCMYFSNDPRFNEQEYQYPNGQKIKLSLKKGIGLISSKKGTGKSILSSLFQQNKYRPFIKIETKNVASLYQDKGDKAIEVHSELLHIAPQVNFYFYDYVGICFDDLGFELPKNNWGSKSDVMADVLFAIYRKNQMKGDFSWFHFTSNLSGKDFEDRYDDRIRDRMREMFNILVVPGETRRK